ncbi:MAG: acyloxyacyl hydrolase [Deltaproteobacteria bacterium]|nr:acyloxyacyl hydrolase [Deltaproteobacteria bacterium]
MQKRLIVWFWPVLLAGLLYAGQAAAFSLRTPEQTGFLVNTGSSYDPQPGFGFAQVGLVALYDYEQIFSHRAPDPLKFKLEGSLGLADDSRWRAFCAFNFFALYYLDALQTQKFRPYIEAGAGIIYNDFQVEGQGLRINFNPQAGIGAEFEMADRRWFGALRTHHVSNGNLHGDNRGINSILLQFGFYFQ